MAPASIYSLPPEILLNITTCLECSDLLTWRKTSSYLYQFTDSHSKVLVPQICHIEFSALHTMLRPDQGLFGGGARVDEDRERWDRVLQLAVASMMEERVNLAPWSIIPLFRRHDVESQETQNAEAEVRLVQRLDMVLHEDGLREEKVVICSSMWDSAVTTSSWRSRWTLIAKRKYAYLHFLQHVSTELQEVERTARLQASLIWPGGVEASTRIITNFFRSPVALPRAGLCFWRTALDMYDFAHPRLLGAWSIGDNKRITSLPEDWQWVRIPTEDWGPFLNSLPQEEREECIWFYRCMQLFDLIPLVVAARKPVVRKPNPFVSYFRQ